MLIEMVIHALKLIACMLKVIHTENTTIISMFARPEQASKVIDAYNTNFNYYHEELMKIGKDNEVDDGK